jgi:hypothetical protein
MEKRAWHQQASFERGFTPTPELFAGERVLGTIEAKLWDIGLFGYLLRRQERLVVTTHRIFQYSTNVAASRLRCLELSKVEVIEVGGKFNVTQLSAGVVFLVAAILLLGSAIVQHDAPRLWMIYSLLSALAGVFTLWASEKKVVRAATGSRNAVAIPLARLRTQEAKSFVDLLSGAMRNLSQPSPTSSRRQNREAFEKATRSLNGDDPRYRKSSPTATFSKQIQQEPDGTLNYSSNGDYGSTASESWRPASPRGKRTFIE